MKKVGVVILNFKVAEQTINCLESVINCDYPEIKIYVVDNNSGDGLEEKLTKFKGINFIQTGQNLGYSGGNNQGIKVALKDDCQLILIVNPDTTLNKETIKNLVVGMEETGAGIAGPKILFSDGKTIWFAGGKLDRANVLGSHLGVDQQDEGQFDAVKEVDFITGAGMMVSSQIFDELELFDERYFLYLEDVDLCWRAKQRGFKVVYLPQATMKHKNAQSTGLGSNLQDYFITRNRLLFAHLHLPLRTQLALWREALRNLGKPVRRQALVDFVSGNFGKGSFLQ